VNASGLNHDERSCCPGRGESSETSTSNFKNGVLDQSTRNQLEKEEGTRAIKNAVQKGGQPKRQRDGEKRDINRELKKGSSLSPSKARTHPGRRHAEREEER